jgi:hypothetical protein
VAAPQFVVISLSHDVTLLTEVPPMARVRGLDRGRVKRVKRTLDAMVVRDSKLVLSNPRGKPIYFPSTDTALVAAVAAVQLRLNNLLEMT